MKKSLPYIIAGLLGIAIIALVITGKNNAKRRMDERVTLRKQDKIAYGTYVAYQELKHIFPQASISTNRYEPGYWDSLSFYDHEQALVIIAGKFNADESEMKKLIDFVSKGNDVFVSAREISYSASDLMDCRVNAEDLGIDYDDQLAISKPDSLGLYLTAPPYGKKNHYVYPGKSLDGWLTMYDEATTEILGEDEQGRPNFIRLRSGKGNFYLHLAPLAFSNYFLLHKNNIDYYEKAMSVINPESKKIVWDEYYLNKKMLDAPNKKKSWFSVLMNEKVTTDDGKTHYPFRAAFWLIIILAVLYTLQEMRRKQRVIPVITKPRNDSMDFVKTIGRLYYDKGDHKNLVRKMAAYFLEHVRHNYKLLTGTLDDRFVKNLSYKSGVAEEEIDLLVGFIKHIDEAKAISDVQLATFHKQLEAFYKKA